MSKTTMLAVAACLLGSMSLAAQEPKGMSSVATFKVPLEKQAAFVDKAKAFVPVMDKLLDAGVITAYGMDVDAVHVPGENNVAFWVDTPNYTSLAKEEAAIAEFMHTNPAVMQDLFGMSDMSAHHDLVLRNWEQHVTAAPAGATPTAATDEVRVKPGRVQEFVELFRKHDKPVLEKLLADGAIYGYWLSSEAVHTMKPGLVWVIIEMSDLGSMDKIRAAVDESYKNLPEGENKLLERLYYEMTEAESHRDSVAVSVVYRSK